MPIRIAQLADNIRISVLDGGLTIYFLPYLTDEQATKLRVYGEEGVALTSGDKVIGGITLQEDSGWYVVESLWSDSAAGAVTLLYSALEYYKMITPSNNVSPAARAVVKRFYNKYKGTEIVVDDALYPGRVEELAAGYVWSDKLRKVPVKVGTVVDEAELVHLWKSVIEGFSAAYSDPRKTKKDDLEGFWLKKNYQGLLDLAQRMFNVGKKRQVFEWVKAHQEELEKVGTHYTSALLQYYYDNIDLY